ncbi:MAG: DUF4416 family protein [Deltaproteobacteria bacterium]|nr:DUF4416 family protein [Deltaproteobacteria bacterium]
MRADEQGPAPAKLFSSVISGATDLIEAVSGELEKEFGLSDYSSPLMDFGYTDYYESEMGGALKRRLLAFERLVSPAELAGIKLFTNGVEGRYLTGDGRRKVNIDPGYLTLYNLIVASCKNYSHRVYLEKGVYAEVTLIFRDGEYRALDWTYPDYRGDMMRGVFREIRGRYAMELGRVKKGV